MLNPYTTGVLEYVVWAVAVTVHSTRTLSLINHQGVW